MHNGIQGAVSDCECLSTCAAEAMRLGRSGLVSVTFFWMDSVVFQFILSGECACVCDRSATLHCIISQHGGAFAKLTAPVLCHRGLLGLQVAANIGMYLTDCNPASKTEDPWLRMRLCHKARHATTQAVNIYSRFHDLMTI